MKYTSVLVIVIQVLSQWIAIMTFITYEYSHLLFLLISLNILTLSLLAHALINPWHNNL
jgi:hypothetical protein